MIIQGEFGKILGSYGGNYAVLACIKGVVGISKKLTLMVLGAILLFSGTLQAGAYLNVADVNNDHRVDIGDLLQREWTGL